MRFLVLSSEVSYSEIGDFEYRVVRFGILSIEMGDFETNAHI